MSKRNETFRNQCDITVFLNKGQETVTVDVKYKQGMYEVPLSQRRSRFFFSDVKEELERQGIVLKEGTFHTFTLDHTSTREEKHTLNATFPLAVKSLTKKGKSVTVTTEETEEAVTQVVEEAKSAKPTAKSNKRNKEQ
jgi:hypothetical protein